MLSTQKTRKPSAISCSVRLTCRGRSFLPGAFISTNASRPPGKRTNRSGTPSNPGDMNFGANPPRLFTSVTNFLSTILSRKIPTPFFICCRCLLPMGFTLSCAYTLFLSLLLLISINHIEIIGNNGNKARFLATTHGFRMLPIPVADGEFGNSRQQFVVAVIGHRQHGRRLS